MKAIDLCAGAGGLSLGLQRAGWGVLGVEIDPVAAATHRANVGPCEQASITEWSPAGPADLVCGGVPCQPFSKQGRQAGLEDPRGRLFDHLVRVAVEAGARACMLENSPGIAYARGGRPPALEVIAEAFASGGFRFMTARVLDAASYGTPQHRERLILVGFRDASDAARFAWPVPSHGPGAPRPLVTMADALIDGWRDPPVRCGFCRETREAFDPSTGEGPRCPACAPPAALETLRAAGLAHRPATTISATGHGRVARPGHKGNGDQWAGCVKLTPAGCAAIQGFPPGFTWPRQAERAQGVIGNAVPPQLGEALGVAVAAALRPA